MKRVVFVGAYGLQNAGDDTPLMVMTQGLRERWPEQEFEFTFVGRHHDPELAAWTDSRFFFNLEYKTKEDAEGVWLHGFNYQDSRIQLEAISRLIKRADLVIAGAGNVFNDISFDLFRGPIPQMAIYAFLADLHETPFFLFGVSAGPLEDERARELTEWVVRRSTTVIARDQDTAELLDSLCVRPTQVWGDPVLGLKPASGKKLARALYREGIAIRGYGRPRLGVALRDLRSIGVGRETVIGALRALSERYELLLIPQCTGPECDDRDEAEEAVRALGLTKLAWISARHCPDVLMRFYETCDRVLAIRLHGAVFGVMAGVPTAALCYLPKVRSFMRGQNCIDVGATPEEIVAAVEGAQKIDVPENGADRYIIEAGRLLGL